jgi:O-antigen ligase
MIAHLRVLNFGSKPTIRVDTAIITLVLAVALITRAAGVSQQTRNVALGFVLTLAGTYLLFDILHRRAFPTLLLRTVLFGTLFTGLYSVSIVYSPNARDALVTVLQLILVLLWFFVVSLVPWTLSTIKTGYVLVSIFILTNAFLWWIGGFDLQFTGFLHHKHNLGGITFACLFFLFYAKVATTDRSIRATFYPVLLLGVLVLWATGSRTSLFTSLFALLIYLMWPLIRWKRALHLATFLVLVGATVGVIFFYLELSQFESFDGLQMLFQKYTRAPLYSGREVIWPILMDHVAEKPVFGWGAGFREETILYHPVSGGLSTHSLYLAVAMQTGLTGTALLWALLYSIWSILFRVQWDRVGRLSAAFFFAICVNQWFELSLIQNNVSIAILFWTITGIGVNRAILINALEFRQRGHSTKVGGWSRWKSGRVASIR